MADRKLTEAFRSVAEAMYPDTVLVQERAVGGALNDDSTVRPDALTAALPWQRLDFRLPGVAATGTSLGGIYELPQGGRIRRISARARVAPSTAPFTGRLVVNGVVEDSGSIQPGSTSIASGASIAVPPGGVVTLNVTSAGEAEDITVSVFYSPAGGTT
jgi:hypothetical protein